MPGCEFFIAYATPDQAWAEELGWQLEDLKREVFIDTSGIEPGGSWRRALVDKLETARVVIVIASEHSRDAHYQGDEITRVVRHARDGRQDVVPIRLGLDNSNLPYGLINFQSIDGSLPGGAKRVARQLSAQFPKDQDEPAPAPEVPLRPDYGLGAALRLNRIHQWSAVMEAAHFSNNFLFLYHGSHDQNVQLFVERIRLFFSAEVEKPRKVCRVRFNIQGATPQTGSDWIGHMRDGLACAGPLADCMAAEIAKQPHFVILGHRPLPAGLLNDRQKEALREFITEDLPATLRKANITSGLAMLLPFDYLTDDPPPLIEEVRQWGLKAQETRWLRFRALPPASLPSWPEVAEYLGDMDPPAPADKIELIKCEYMQRAANPDLSFDELARIVDSYTLNV